MKVALLSWPSLFISTMSMVTCSEYSQVSFCIRTDEQLEAFIGIAEEVLGESWRNPSNTSLDSKCTCLSGMMSRAWRKLLNAVSENVPSHPYLSMCLLSSTLMPQIGARKASPSDRLTASQILQFADENLTSFSINIHPLQLFGQVYQGAKFMGVDCLILSKLHLIHLDDYYLSLSESMSSTDLEILADLFTCPQFLSQSPKGVLLAPKIFRLFPEKSQNEVFLGEYVAQALMAKNYSLLDSSDFPESNLWWLTATFLRNRLYEHGDLDFLKAIVARPRFRIEINQQDLEEMVAHGKKQMVDYLLNSSNFCIPSTTSFKQAVARGHWGTVDFLMNRFPQSYKLSEEILPEILSKGNGKVLLEFIRRSTKPYVISVDMMKMSAHCGNLSAIEVIFENIVTGLGGEQHAKEEALSFVQCVVPVAFNEGHVEILKWFKRHSDLLDREFPQLVISEATLARGSESVNWYLTTLKRPMPVIEAAAIFNSGNIALLKTLKDLHYPLNAPKHVLRKFVLESMTLESLVLVAPENLEVDEEFLTAAFKSQSTDVFQWALRCSEGILPVIDRLSDDKLEFFKLLNQICGWIPSVELIGDAVLSENILASSWAFKLTQCDAETLSSSFTKVINTLVSQRQIGMLRIIHSHFPFTEPHILEIIYN